MLDQLDQRVRRLARDYLTKPVVPLVAELAALRNRLFGLLGERQALSHARGLYVLACRVCGLLACASSDRFGAYRAAAQQAETAWLCAKEAGYGELKAWVRSIQSTIDFWRGRYQEAAERARAGQAYAREGLELVRLASLEARACGRLGDARGVQGAVALATAARDGASGQDEGRHAGAFGFSVANQVRCAGSARLWLGDPRAVAQAREELDQALRLFDADPEGPSYAHLAVTRVDLTIAHLRLGDLDGAAEALRTVLALPPDRRLAGVVRRSGELRRLLTAGRYRRAPLAGELDRELRAFCEANVTREPAPTAR